MAIGARITSTNLSGKTATVTFTPYTGSTSGSTVNLGTQTIPFNNITSHPYGDYAIYLAEYDYTYTLNIPEPVLDTQLYIWVDQMVNDNNYGAATLNFNDLTAEVIDLGVDSNLWYLNNLYPLNESGFGYQFQGQNDYNDKLVIFTDASNIEIGRYTGNTNNWDMNTLNGKWITFEDGDNGILTYSNGVNVYTYTWDPTTHNTDIEWDYDATTSDDSFLFTKYDFVNGTDNHTYIFKSDGTQVSLMSWDSANNNSLYYNYYFSMTSSMIVAQGYSDNDGIFTEMVIFDGDANPLQTISFNNPYNCRNYGFEGTNKFHFIAYNCYDNGYDYQILHYNEVTDNLISTSHIRGNDYTNINTSYNNPSWVNNNTDGLVISFSNSGSWNNWSYDITYCDFVYMLEGQTSFTTYTFANNESKSINTWGDVGSNYLVRCGTGDGYASYLSITSSGSSIQSLGYLIADITNTNDWNINNRKIEMAYFNQDYTGSTITLIGSDASVQHQMNLEYVGPWGNMTTRSQNYSFYISVSTVTGDTGYYVNDSVTGFTQTEFYPNTRVADGFSTTTGLRTSDIVLYDQSNLICKVLSKNSIGNQISLSPWNNEFNIEVGNDKFMVIYNEGETGYYTIKLYDFTGTLLNTVNTTYDNINNSIAVKDRFAVRFWDNNNNRYVMYLISPTLTPSVYLASNNTYDTANDIVWWD